MKLKRIYKRPAIALGLALMLNLALASSALANLPGGGGSKASSCELAPKIVHNEPGICSPSGYQSVDAGSIHENTQPVEATGSTELPWAFLAGLVTLVVAASGLIVVIRRRPQPAA